MKALATTFVVLLGLLCCNKLLAFQSLFPRAWNRHYDSQQSWGGSSGTAPRMTATSRDLGNENDSKSFLLDEFCTYAGEVVDPYQTLKVSRDAQRSDIRQAYLGLSKRYHPDGVRHRDILPGKCNNLDDVREEWERIKLSYEILSDKKTRQRYDRHSMLADPRAAIGRAAVDAVGKGIIGLGQGLFKVGALAVKQIAKDTDR